MLLYVHFSFAIILMEERELVALLSLSSWCLVMVVWLFLAVTWVCLRFVIVVFPDHTHYFYCIVKSTKQKYSLNISALQYIDNKKGSSDNQQYFRKIYYI